MSLPSPHLPVHRHLLCCGDVPDARDLCHAPLQAGGGVFAAGALAGPELRALAVPVGSRASSSHTVPLWRGRRLSGLCRWCALPRTCLPLPPPTASWRCCCCRRSFGQLLLRTSCPLMPHHDWLSLPPPADALQVAWMPATCSRCSSNAAASASAGSQSEPSQCRICCQRRPQPAVGLFLKPGFLLRTPAGALRSRSSKVTCWTLATPWRTKSMMRMRIRWRLPVPSWVAQVRAKWCSLGLGCECDGSAFFVWRALSRVTRRASLPRFLQHLQCGSHQNWRRNGCK